LQPDEPLTDEPLTDEEKAAARRDRQETWDAFIIVMGVSLFPLIFASIGILLIHFQIIHIPEYNPGAQTVKGLGRGLYTVTYFASAGLLVPIVYAVFVLRRNLRERRQTRKEGP
jgi:hypothetical protein